MKLSIVTCAVVCSVLGSGCELLEILDIGSGDEDGPRVNVYSHQITDGEPQNIGSSCTAIGSGSGSTTSGSNDENGYWIEEVSNDDGLSIRLHVGDEIVEEHNYDRVFIESGEVDRFVLTVPDDAEFSYAVWGADECETCPPSPHAPLPGDLLCGTSGESTEDYEPADEDHTGAQSNE